MLAVILRHAGAGAGAGVGSVAGEFRGVDPDFLISGRLITTLIDEDLDAGRFDLARFHER